MSDEYVPERGHVVWLRFQPQTVHEQAGRRPALVLSPGKYNQRVGLALVCPITSKVKRYPFEVELPVGLNVQGVVLADQVRSLDWRARRAQYILDLPDESVATVIAKLQVLLDPSS